MLVGGAHDDEFGDSRLRRTWKLRYHLLNLRWSTEKRVSAVQSETKLVIRRLVHHSWYGPAVERPWAGTSWKGTAGQGPAIRSRQALDRQDFPMSISIDRPPGRIDGNKQCFHNQYMHTCLLRATLWKYSPS